MIGLYKPWLFIWLKRIYLLEINIKNKLKELNKALNTNQSNKKKQQIYKINKIRENRLKFITFTRKIDD